MENLEITILCKVVDNFGDIGVVYRLTRNLITHYPEVSVNLIVQGLDSFNKINNKINPALPIQELEGFTVFDWDNFDFCYKYFSGKNNSHLQVILECFQCGRPDWMEKILFEDELTHIVNVIMIDYLTAEDYAESFHCLKSLTRRAKVQKVNFMPGFTNKTGGLIFDTSDTLVKADTANPVMFFCYDADWRVLVNALNKFCKDFGPNDILVAQGKGHDSFCKAYDELCKDEAASFKVIDLPFMNQQKWDLQLQNCSFLFIRGEESLSRACLYGIPFVWPAYPQSEEYHLVKVRALLSKMEPFFDKSDFSIIKNAWESINSINSDIDKGFIEESLFNMLKNQKKMQEGFRNFSLDLRKNGDLVFNLMTFIHKNIII